MKYRLCRNWAPCFLSLAWFQHGCHEPLPSPPAPRSPVAVDSGTALPDSRVLGKPIEEALKLLRLTLKESFVIHEPPGVARGVEGIDPDGAEVWLYVDRSKPGFRESMRWTIADFHKEETIGVARRIGKGWKTCGRVIGYWHR